MVREINESLRCLALLIKSVKNQNGQRTYINMILQSIILQEYTTAMILGDLKRMYTNDMLSVKLIMWNSM